MCLRFDELVDVYIEMFPEIISNYDDTLFELREEGRYHLVYPLFINDSDYIVISQKEVEGNPFVYPFYEMIVRDSFRKLMETQVKSKREEDLLSKVLDYFERMALSDDVEVRNVLSVAVFEGIIDAEDDGVLKAMGGILKSNSKRLFENRMKYLGHTLSRQKL